MSSNRSYSSTSICGQSDCGKIVAMVRGNHSSDRCVLLLMIRPFISSFGDVGFPYVRNCLKSTGGEMLMLMTVLCHSCSLPGLDMEINHEAEMRQYRGGSSDVREAIIAKQQAACRDVYFPSGKSWCRNLRSLHSGFFELEYCYATPSCIVAGFQAVLQDDMWHLGDAGKVKSVAEREDTASSQTLTLFGDKYSERMAELRAAGWKPVEVSKYNIVNRPTSISCWAPPSHREAVQKIPKQDIRTGQKCVNSPVAGQFANGMYLSFA